MLVPPDRPLRSPASIGAGRVEAPPHSARKHPTRGRSGGPSCLSQAVIPLVLTVIVLALAPAYAGDRSSLGARTFYFNYSYGEDISTRVYGVEVNWGMTVKQWNFGVEVPAISLESRSLITVIGPGIPVGPGEGQGPTGESPGGSETEGDGGTGGTGGGGGTGSGNGPGSESGSGGSPPPSAATQTSGAASESTFTADDRVSGLGDIRLYAQRWLGQGRPWGRLSARAGLKLPTADEETGLGTGSTDGWLGVGWVRQGWATNLSAYVDYVALGDTDYLTLEDGLAAGFFVDRPFRRGSLMGGLEAAQPPVVGGTTRLRATVAGSLAAGRKVWLSAQLYIGLTDDPRQYGIVLSIVPGF